MKTRLSDVVSAYIKKFLKKKKKKSWHRNRVLAL